MDGHVVAGIALGGGALSFLLGKKAGFCSVCLILGGVLAAYAIFPLTTGRWGLPQLLVIAGVLGALVGGWFGWRLSRPLPPGSAWRFWCGIALGASTLLFLLFIQRNMPAHLADRLAKQEHFRSVILLSYTGVVPGRYETEGLLRTLSEQDQKEVVLALLKGFEKAKWIGPNRYGELLRFLYEKGYRKNFVAARDVILADKGRARDALAWWMLGNSSETRDNPFLPSLFAAGVPVDYTDAAGRPMFVYACKYGRWAVAERFLDAGVTVDLVDDAGNTCLHHAETPGVRNEAFAQRLRAAGATP